jgi:hypothetical protein
MSMQIKNQVGSHVLDEMHKADNALLHQKTLNQIVIALAPVMVKIIEEGIQKGVWNCKYPLQYMQIFLASVLTLTDEGIFELDDVSQMKIITALISMLEEVLSVPEDSFMKLFMEKQNNN